MEHMLYAWWPFAGQCWRVGKALGEKEGVGRRRVIKAESCYPEVVDGGMCFIVQVH